MSPSRALPAARSGRIRIKRVYDPPARSDGHRVLVERLWPRGMTKAALRMDAWAKELAPSNALRRWFGHGPARWPAFVQRYTVELARHPEAWRPLVEWARRGPLTLLYSARDVEHNSAVVLQRFLLRRMPPVRAAASSGSHRRTVARLQPARG